MESNQQIQTIEEYQQEVLRTLSDRYHGDSVNGALFLKTIDSLVKISETLDQFKKALFYGKLIPPSTTNEALVGYESINLNPQYLEANAVSLSTLFPKTEKEFNTLHALIGLLTETTEALENYFSPEYSELNQVEEVGDISWYYALLLHSLTQKPSEVWEANIRKLKTRYPEKFEKALALDRNLAAEKQALL